MRASLRSGACILSLLLVLCVASSPVDAQTCFNENMPGWAAYASVSGWITNWRERQDSPSFWQVRFRGTLYINSILAQNNWCIQAAGTTYDERKQEIPNSGIEVQFRHYPDLGQWYLSRGFRPEGIWYGYRLHVNDKIVFERDGVERRYRADYVWCSGFGLSPVPFAPAPWQRSARVDMTMTPFIVQPDSRNFNAGWTAATDVRRGEARGYDVRFRVTRRWEFPENIQTPQVEVYRSADGTSNWQLFSRTTMQRQQADAYGLRNLQIGTGGVFFFRVIMGTVDLIDLPQINTGPMPTAVKVEAYWDADCNRFYSDFTVPPGRVATDFRVSLVTGWLPCSRSAARHVETITWDLTPRPPELANTFLEFLWNNKSPELPPFQLGPGTYQLRITNGARSATLTLEYTLR